MADHYYKTPSNARKVKLIKSSRNNHSGVKLYTTIVREKAISNVAPWSCLLWSSFCVESVKYNFRKDPGSLEHGINETHEYKKCRIELTYHLNFFGTKRT